MYKANGSNHLSPLCGSRVLHVEDIGACDSFDAILEVMYDEKEHWYEVNIKRAGCARCHVAHVCVVNSGCGFVFKDGGSTSHVWKVDNEDGCYVHHESGAIRSYIENINENQFSINTRFEDRDPGIIRVSVNTKDDTILTEVTMSKDEKVCSHVIKDTKPCVLVRSLCYTYALLVCKLLLKDFGVNNISKSVI